MVRPSQITAGRSVVAVGTLAVVGLLWVAVLPVETLQ